MQNLMVLRLRQLEEGGEGEEGGQRHDAGVAGELVGATQRDLLRWYFDYLVKR